MRKLYLFIVLIGLLSCKSNKVNNHLADIDASYIYFNKEDEEIDERLDAMIKPYREQLAEKMDVVLIQNERELKKGKPNCNMGSWIADMLKDYCDANGTPVDFAVQNYGGLRTNSVGKGDLTVGNIYEVMPFENMLVVLNTKGDVVKQFCDHMAASEGWPVSKGLEFSIANGAASKIMVNGKPLDMEKIYSYAVPDYIANGGSDCAFFKDLPQKNTAMLIRQIMLDATKARGEKGLTLNVENVKRIHE